MIVRSLCNRCFQPFHILLEAGDAGLLKEISLEDEGRMCRCPRLCGGKINLVGSPAIDELASILREPMTLTGKELYVAVHGLGLPDEIEKNPEVIKSLLVANKVVAAEVEEVQGRLYLHELKLDNGLTVHLSSGARGAQVLKVTKEKQCQPPTP